MAHYGRVSVVLEGHETSPATGEYPHHPDSARQQVATWNRDPRRPGSIIAVTWEWVLPSGQILAIVWERGASAEIILPCL